MKRRAFFPLREYPELEPVRRRWYEIREEGRSLLPDMVWIEDERTSGRVWAFAPLQPEEEDKDAYLDGLSISFRARAPKTVKLVSAIPNILGYGFSLLLASSNIGSHKHRNPFVTAMIGLSVGKSCWVTVNTEARRIRPGRTLIFDYTLSHEVTNQSVEDRLVLLILLPNKSLCY